MKLAILLRAALALLFVLYAEVFFARIAAPIRAVVGHMGRVGKGDLAEVGRLGHRLKGTIVYLGAEPAEKTAIAVEEFLQGGEPAQAEEAVRAFEQECERLESALALHKGLVSTVAAPSQPSESPSWDACSALKKR